MSKNIKSASPVFVDMKALEERANANGYTRSRRDLSARRLLNGNYLTVAVTRIGSPRFGQRYAVRLVETTDGVFYRKNGKNVVEIHNEAEVTNWYNGRDKTYDLVVRFEAQIDIMLDLDRQRLANGNYLTIVEDVKEAEEYAFPRGWKGDDAHRKRLVRKRKFMLVETTDGDFRGRFVKIHEEFPEEFGLWGIEALAKARAAQAHILAEDARAAIRSKAA